MGFSNTVQKLTEKLLGGSSSSELLEDEAKTKTIDLPDMQSEVEMEPSAIDKARLSEILSEDSQSHQKRLLKLKETLAAGNYSAQSEDIARAILDYPGDED